MKRRVVLALIAALGGCGDNAKVTPDAAVAIDAQLPDSNTAVPRAEPGPCRFTVPVGLGLVQGTNYFCGDLVVEENRGTHAGTIRVHYIRIKSTSGSPNATIYLDGGPGGDGQGILAYAGYLGKPFLNSLLVDGDFLVIGQRGTRLSKPYLECTAPDCSNLFGTADLASFNTAYNADDVNDLRAVLGYDKLNIYGISYGSRLGLEVLRRHGQHVRAAVIEGLVPSQTQWVAAVPASAYSAISSLNTSCADAGACGTAFGNLVTKFTTGVDALNTQPVEIMVQGQPFSLDGDTYANLIFQLLYSKSTFAYLPLIINDLAIRRTDRVSSILANYLQAVGGHDDNGGGVSRGLYFGVVCGELFNPADANSPTTANEGVPQAFVDIFGGSFDYIGAVCDTYPKGNLQTALAQPVTSSVRSLVSSGRLDPITPPSFGTVAAATLSNSVHIIHENSGHGATLQSACGQQNLAKFLANPTATHDMTCAASITTNYSIPASAASVPAPSIKQLRAELSIAPRFPLRRRPR